MANLEKLRTELLLPKYSGMSDQEAADDLNRKVISVDRTSVPSIEVIESIEPAAYPTDARMQSYLSSLLSQDTVPLDSPNIRNALKAIFSGETATLAALAALQKVKISRAEEIGIGFVKIGFVKTARA